MANSLEESHLPEAVAVPLRDLKESLASAAGSNLAALVLYGGLARGRYRPGKSDINVLVLLRDGSKDSLAAIAPALQAAWRKDLVEPMVFTAAELPQVAAEFPVKFLDIKGSHIVLAGEDLLTGLTVDPGVVRRRLRQELRNLTLRLRRRYVLVHDEPGEIARALSRIANPLCVQLLTLLTLDGKRPGEITCAVVFDAASRDYGLDRAVLAALEDLRGGQGASDPAKLLGDTLALLSKVLERLGAPEARP